MKKERVIPITKPSVYDEFHFGKVKWTQQFPAEQHLFHISRLEDFRDKMIFPLPPHRKVVNDLIFITKGKSIRNKGLNSYPFNEHQFFFLPALQITEHQFMSEDVEGFYLHYSSEILGEYNHILNQFSFLKFLEHPVVSIPEVAVPTILNILNRMEELYVNWKKTNLNLVVFYLLTLFAEVNQYLVKPEKKTRKNTATLLTEQYKDALTKHIYQKQTVQEYAELLFVTPNHLNKCVKQTINKTAKDLLNDMLILEGKSLLKYSNLSIAEIAEKLYGRTSSNFSRFFKSQTGMTPKQYAKG
ncbi:MAG: helix-turn-helix domain-containing protein [Saprospiraceae bacterium]